MVLVPAPRLFQYIERSTVIFFPGVREVTMVEALPPETVSFMLKVNRDFAAIF